MSSDRGSRASTSLDGQVSDPVKEKHGAKTVNATLQCVDSQTTDSDNIAKPGLSSWKTSFLRLAPITGIVCMLAAAASIVAALGILVGSRGAATTSWTIPPSTYLAIFTAIANQALRFAAFQGLAIAWWFRAARGDSLAQLHRSWRAGVTAGGAIISHRNMGWIGLACLCSTLVAIDGPFLQKATTIELEPFNEPPMTLNVTIAQEIPHDYTGGWYRTNRFGRLSAAFNLTIPSIHGNISNLIAIDAGVGFKGPAGDYAQISYFEDNPISKAVRGCPSQSICRATVRAPALAVASCRVDSVPVDYWTHLKDKENVIMLTNVAPPLETTNFLIDISLLQTDKEKINLITGHAITENCTGTFYYKICTLESAIGEYNITITDGDKVTVGDDPPRIIALANNTEVNHTWNEEWQMYPSTLAGIVGMAYQKHESAANSYIDHGKIWQAGYFPNVYRQYANPHDKSGCWTYRDPWSDVITDLNKLMFLIGVAAANDEDRSRVQASIDSNLPITTTAQGHLIGSHNVFATNLHWFGAAAVVELICIALILPTYFGYWKLGRSVSFSPLEIAKAFEAPLLSDYNSNSTGSGIAKAVGNTQVQYGQINRAYDNSYEDTNQVKLAFADPTLVSWPQKDAKFGT